MRPFTANDRSEKAHLMVILSVECDDVEVEDGPLSDDDDDGRET